jgi:hypothetical protein
MKVAWPATGLVHGVVDHLGEEVMQRLLVRAADIHARPTTDGLQPLQHLDRGGIVARLARGALLGQVAGNLDGCVPRRSCSRALGGRAPEEIVGHFRPVP